MTGYFTSVMRGRTAHVVLQFLAKHSTIQIPHPPYSPDLAPNDFFLYPKLKINLKGRKFDNVDMIQAESKATLRNLSKSDFISCFDNWKKRWNGYRAVLEINERTLYIAPTPNDKQWMSSDISSSDIKVHIAYGTVDIQYIKMAPAVSIEGRNVLNFNIGVLGHIDSGKTSLSKALSTTASTASFDKNPQSQERGITIDLGFSSFSCDFPQHLQNDSKYTVLQFTLVDCPGHSSLIRTIIGVLLPSNRPIHITFSSMLERERTSVVDRVGCDTGAQIVDLVILVVDVVKGVQTQTAECLVIAEITCDKMVVVLNKTDQLPEAKREAHVDKGEEGPIGILQLKELLCKEAYIPRRNPGGPLLVSVDHCFSIKGQGTVMTGTLLQGSLEVNQGDRVGICVTQFDPAQLERGLICSPGHLTYATHAIVAVHRIPYFRAEILTKAKFHITALHDTRMAKLTFFSPVPGSGETFDLSQEYSYQSELTATAEGEAWYDARSSRQYVLLEFVKPTILCPGSLIIGSHLDYDIHSKSCRLAFHGQVLQLGGPELLPALRVFKVKSKEGMVDRMSSPHDIIVRNLFKKETNLKLFQSLPVALSTGEQGAVEGWFGQSGKVKVHIPGTRFGYTG
ncbi:EEFSEC [Cordylochernes scorpioides]|uniref:EEFSEC n=1 Tax=Cordylochernes scorpioides TaxID=51811 RepID=A0ABY6KNS2_9ARAC|nr:EEFSEC [Cordylochernes scorpioides]